MMMVVMRTWSTCDPRNYQVAPPRTKFQGRFHVNRAPLVDNPVLSGILPQQVGVAEDAQMDGETPLRDGGSKETDAGEVNVAPTLHHNGVHSRPSLNTRWFSFLHEPADVAQGVEEDGALANIIAGITNVASSSSSSCSVHWFILSFRKQVCRVKIIA